MKDVFSSPMPRAGDLLIASPAMAENLFSRTLVYLQHFDTNGALGFILNRPTGQVVRSGMLPEGSPSVPVPVFFGGPVEPGHMVLAAFSPRGATGFIAEPTFPAEQSENEVPGRVTRGFMGYAGWSAGQLDEELANGDWIWRPADRMFLRNESGELAWNLAVSGDDRWTCLRDNLPQHPEKN